MKCDLVAWSCVLGRDECDRTRQSILSFNEKNVAVDIGRFMFRSLRFLVTCIVFSLKIVNSVEK